MKLRCLCNDSRHQEPDSAGHSRGLPRDFHKRAGKFVIQQSTLLHILPAGHDFLLLACHFRCTDVRTRTASPATFYKDTVATLPADFSMPSGVQCPNPKTITAYQSCGVGNSNTVVMVTSDDFSSSVNFGMTLEGIVNPKTASTLQGSSGSAGCI